MSVYSVQILLFVRGGKTVCLSKQDQSYINIYLLTVYFLFSISAIFMSELLENMFSICITFCLQVLNFYISNFEYNTLRYIRILTGSHGKII